MMRVWKMTAVAIALSVAAAATTLEAQGRAVVIELFTSQGCSSCPPADEYLHELAKRDDVIALALHVDYWDYIGWKDIFADPAYTARQRKYAKVAGRRMVYTPQMIINGQQDVVGNRPQDVTDLIDAHKAQPAQVRLHVTRQGREVQIKARDVTGQGHRWDVQIAAYRPKSPVKITRGENAGRTFTYANVVTELARVAQWQGDAPLAMTAKTPGDGPVAVIIQRSGLGRIGAAQIAK
ncbi:DUF1223 domain-containing protein [Roseovarius sp. C7]|uniref:DUF1223 domain-containing protein n=1 Tax=Roseovarius sp. C7 TaxID=3398643 RepID=UPI0039F65EB0